MIVRQSTKGKRFGEFGQLVRGHRERLGITITDLARYASIDQGLLSKIERGLRRPPQLVPYVERLTSRFKLKPSSTEYRQLVDAAYRERFGGGPTKGANPPLLLTLGVAPSRGLSGVNPYWTAPDSPAGRYYRSQGPRVSAGLNAPDDTVAGAQPAEARLKGPTLPAATPSVPPVMTNATDFAQLLSMAAGYGIEVNRFEQKGNRCRVEFRSPRGEEYVMTIEQKKRKSEKRGRE